MTAPLVEEIKALRVEIETLKQRQLEPTEQIPQPAKDEVQEGIIVRLAKRFEALLRR